VSFKARFRQPLHPLIAHTWFNIYTYRHDLMHMSDHHGVAGSVSANIFDTHLSNRDGPLPGSNRDDRLAVLNGDIRAYNSFHGVKNRLPPLKHENICVPGEYPNLKGTLVKAANTRSIIPYCVALQRRATTIDSSAKQAHVKGGDGLARNL